MKVNDVFMRSPYNKVRGTFFLSSLYLFFKNSFLNSPG